MNNLTKKGYPRKRSVRHSYPTENQLRSMFKSEGPTSAACAEAGGKLLTPPPMKLHMPGRGCGSLVGVLATSSKAPCGVKIKWPDGEVKEHLCPYCARDIAKQETLNNKGETV